MSMSRKPNGGKQNKQTQNPKTMMMIAAIVERARSRHTF
jgi:hypothetical protein